MRGRFNVDFRAGYWPGMSWYNQTTRLFGHVSEGRVVNGSLMGRPIREERGLRWLFAMGLKKAQRIRPFCF